MLRTPPARLIAVGAGVLLAAQALVVVSRHPLMVTVAALLVGLAWACMHSTMQAWATEVLPVARAVMVALFSGVLFVGSGLLTSLVAPLAGQARWSALFGVGLCLTAAFLLLAPWARSAYRPVNAPRPGA